MSEIFDNGEKLQNVKKNKKEMSAERKAMLLENLKRGRETSAKNRAKKAKAKQIKKKNEKIDIDETIEKEILKGKSKRNFESEIDQLRFELTELRNGQRPKLKIIDEEPIEQKKPLPPVIKTPVKEHVVAQPVVEKQTPAPIQRQSGLVSKKDIIESFNKPKTQNLMSNRWDWD